MKHKPLGAEGMSVAILVTIALGALNFFVFNSNPMKGETGICLPSPDLWTLPPIWSASINIGLLLCAGLGLFFLNKTYSVIQTTSTVWPSAFLVLCSSCPWIFSGLSAGVIMVVINVLSLFVLFDAYKRANATQETFLVATLLSVGTMFQYGFLFLIPAYLLMLVPLNIFRIKEITSFLLGLFAPYWVAVGMGWIPIENFSIPQFSTFIQGFTPPTNLIKGLVVIGLTALWSLILALNNAVRLYAGNTRRRLLNNSVILLGIFTLVAMIVDFNNLTAYLPSFYLAASLQLANAFALWQIPRGRMWLSILTVIYIVAFFFTI
ncbi:MAG: hypothetical protein K2M59_04385 [Muribaculaceae bacterium]|nr:hypothetical protein [Muribaculaceae bacterium]